MTDHLSPDPGTLRLTWPRPAAEWIEAAPIGNGRTGAMVFGGRERSRLQLNDSSVWSGTPDRGARALDAVVAAGAGPERLAAVRAAIDAGDYRTAEDLLYAFEGPWSQEFLPFADLVIETGPSADASADGAADDATGHSGDDYLRELDLDRGTVVETFGAPGARVRRTFWASAPAGAVLVHLESERPFDLHAVLTTPLRVERVQPTATGLTLGVQLPIDGAPLHEEAVADPLVYAELEESSGESPYDAFGAVALSARTDGGVTSGDDGLRVSGARRVLLAIVTDSTGRRWWNGADPAALTSAGRSGLVDDVTEHARQAVAREAESLLAEHVTDLDGLLGASVTRIGARRGGRFDVASEVLRGDDDALVATVLHQFGRYLLVSASRPGSPPANLQGIWNDELRPPWSSNYTININTQMNYWAAESTGLGEAHEPLLRLIEKLSVTGAPTARRLYGARGWVAHHNTDPWGWSLPVGAGHGNPSWAIWMMGGIWLTDHLWQHWIYTLDEGFLRERAWPVLVGAAEFALDWLVDDGRGGLRTVPSTSPENLFHGPDGHPESLAQSSTMDTAVIRALFVRLRRAAATLGISHPVLHEISEALPRMVAFAPTADGRLREWGEELSEVDPDHRHMSQMVAVYPLGLIDRAESRELAEAAVGTLDRRGPGAMGWSWAWKIALRARLGDGETARSLLQEASAPFERDHRRLAPVDGSEWGGLLPNLFSTHPPFQIDGNYGFTAGIREMLIGTREGEIRLLPALPAAWSEGTVSGAHLPGALSVDLEWADGAPTRVAVHRLATTSPKRVDLVWGERTWSLELTGPVTDLPLPPHRIMIEEEP